MSKLDWMYKSSNTPDPEEYLLGRSIDKNYEKQGSSHNEVDKDILPTSIFAGGNSNVQVDVFRKKKEDPLEQIKQKEIEMRKQLLKNPVKLKKLQSMLKAKEEKKNHKDKKKKKKKSKNKDIDDLLAEKYMKLINKYGAKNLVELTKSDEEYEEESSKVRKNKQKKRVRSSSSSLSLSSDDERSSRRRNYSPQRKDSSKPGASSKKKSKRRSRSRGSDPRGREKSRGTQERRSRSPHQAREDSQRRSHRAREDQKGRDRLRQCSTSPSSSEGCASDQNETAALQRTARMKDYDYSSDEGKSKFKKAYGLVLPKGVEPKPAARPQSSGTRGDGNSGTRGDGNSGTRGDGKTSEAKPTKFVRPKPTRMTEEEKQAKLKEMMEDAQRWEKARKSKITKYQEEQKKEEAQEKKVEAQEKKFDGEFMRKELAKATSKSVAERIKSNINNLQRSKFSMEQNFAKKI